MARQLMKRWLVLALLFIPALLSAQAYDTDGFDSTNAFDTDAFDFGAAAVSSSGAVGGPFGIRGVRIGL